MARIAEEPEEIRYGLVSLAQIYRFSYVLALRSFCRPRIKDVLRLVLEPCNYWRNVEVPAVLNRLGVQRGERVLDIGSPKLPSLFAWYRLGAEVWATDLFPYFFEEYSHYRERLQPSSSSGAYHIEVQDARGLTYPDSYFDKAYSISVLEHIEDEGDTTAIREIARVLKPGGLCCLTVPLARHYSEESTSHELYYKKPVDGKPVFYQRHYDEEALQTRLIDPSKLQLCSIERYGERWIPYERLYGKLPRLIRIPVSLIGPISSKLFLYKIGRSSRTGPKTSLIVLKKAVPAPGGPVKGMA
jgi:ubiquinone/menaquinone biosynthesis C-methylase UbiE